MSITYVVLTVAFFTFLLGACKKNDSPDNSGKRLQRIITARTSVIGGPVLRDSIKYTYFIYDALGRVVSIKDSTLNNFELTQEFSIEYNEEGDPVKLGVYGPGVNGRIWFGFDSLVYQNDQVIKKLRITSSWNSYAITNIYFYDSHGRLVVDSAHKRDGTIRFTYDNNDNVIQWQSYSKAHTGVEPYETIVKETALYNSIESPYSLTLYAYSYFLSGDPMMLSKHNRIQTTWESRNPWNYHKSIADYTYKYDSNGLIEKVVVNATGRGGTFHVSTTNFFYE